MAKVLEFRIDLPLSMYDKIERIEDKSVYDCNYYLLRPYEDWISFYGNHILKEIYDEEYNVYTYTFGKFVDEQFVGAFGYTTDENEIEKSGATIINIRYDDI